MSQIKNKGKNMKKEILKNCFKIENKLSDKELKRNLAKLYDVINKIAATLPDEVTKDWFMTDEQLEKMKNNPKYRFI